MIKLFKFLKPYGGAVLAILCVLVVQAYCDLSLPTYTSDIVNVGLQQKGIDEKVPEMIGEEDLDHLLLFVPAEKQETVKEAYVAKEAVSENYEGNVLELAEDVKEDKDRVEELSEILGRPMLLCSGFDSGSDSAVEMEKQMKQQMEEQMKEQADRQLQEMSASGQAPDGQPEELRERTEAQMPDVSQMTIYEIFGMMEESQRDAAIESIEEQFAAMPETMVEQSAAVYIAGAYEKLGVDLDRRETRYILVTGAKMLALAALGMLASILVGLLASRVGARIGQTLRKDVFRKVVGFSNGEFDKFSSASLITRSTNDIQQIQLLTVMILRMVMYAPIMAAGGIECGYVMDHSVSGRIDCDGGCGALYRSDAEVQGGSEYGGQAEPGEP